MGKQIDQESLYDRMRKQLDETVSNNLSDDELRGILYKQPKWECREKCQKLKTPRSIHEKIHEHKKIHEAEDMDVDDSADCEEECVGEREVAAGATNEAEGCMNDNVNHPAHYAAGRKYEPKDVIHDWGLNFNLGNVVKYVSRAGRKPGCLMVEDLEKAKAYLQFELDAIRQDELDMVKTAIEEYKKGKHEQKQ